MAVYFPRESNPMAVCRRQLLHHEKSLFEKELGMCMLSLSTIL